MACSPIHFCDPSTRTTVLQKITLGLAVVVTFVAISVILSWNPNLENITTILMERDVMILYSSSLLCIALFVLATSYKGREAPKAEPPAKSGSTASSPTLSSISKPPSLPDLHALEDAPKIEKVIFHIPHVHAEPENRCHIRGGSLSLREPIIFRHGFSPPFPLSDLKQEAGSLARSRELWDHFSEKYSFHCECGQSFPAKIDGFLRD